MYDLICIIATLGFFSLGILYVIGCDRL